MSGTVSVKVTGLQELLTEFRELPQKMQARVIRGAAATGAKVLRDAAVTLAPVWSGPVAKGHPPAGTLKRSIYYYRAVNRCTPELEWFSVNVKSGNLARATKVKGATVNQDAYYARWVEYGHWTRAPGKTAREHKQLRQINALASTGAKWVPPHPFMRPAFFNHKDEAVAAAETYFNDRVRVVVGTMRFLKAVR